MEPVVLNIPTNGIRLRFDGPDQRLRLIEITDFTKMHLSYKNLDLVKLPDSKAEPKVYSNTNSPTGPIFRHVYNRLMGPTFPGEYIPPASNTEPKKGLYVLSYPGIAFTFPLDDSAWSSEIDFVSLLSSNAASQAQSLAIFHGPSWQEVRQDLFVKPCPNPRSLALSGRGKELHPDEVDLVKIHGSGKVEMVRRSSAPFLITLSETAPQDLVAELGPPDAIHRKNDRRLSIHKTRQRDQLSYEKALGASPAKYDDSIDTDQSSNPTTTDESDIEDDSSPSSEKNVDRSAECFYNYFHHGFDIFISYPASPSPPFPSSQPESELATNVRSLDHLVVTKVLLHGNVPGSYPFNRYRRSRWRIVTPSIQDHDVSLTSETPFNELSRALKSIWKGTYANENEEKSLQRGMVLNRGWGDSPGSSCELLGGWEESSDMQKKGTTHSGNGTPGLGNTELFGFPGLVFEVLKNDFVSCVTIY
jgi:isoleucyl-tRNA synthetase